MKIFFSIILNASILYIITILLNTVDHPDSIVIWELWWQTYLIAWVILWVLNITVKPVLKILWLPLSIFFHWLVVLIINGIILWLFEKIINNILLIEWIAYKINDWWNFVIAVAIFTFLNMLYSLLFNKK